MKKVSISLLTGVGVLGGMIHIVSAGATDNAASGLIRIVTQIQAIINSVIPAMIGLAVIAFFWGVILYLFGKKKEEGRSFMLWGVIALFVMTSVWGLVGMLRSTLFGNDAGGNYKSVDFAPPGTK